MKELIDRNNVITSIVKSLGIRSSDYLLPAEKAIVEVIQKEPTVCDIEQIRAEIDELEIYYDNDYFSGNRDAMFKRNDVLQIINKYREEQTDAT